MKFQDADGKKYVKHGSGHIVFKQGTSYFVATSRTNCFYKTPNGELLDKPIEGFFFLNRTSKAAFKCIWKFDDSDVTHMAEDNYNFD